MAESVSDLENLFGFQIKATRLPSPNLEYRFWPGRRFRFDFAWPEFMLAVEVDGGTWSGGAHNRGEGIKAQMVKLNEATLRGWAILRFDTDMVQSGVAIATLERFFSAVAARA